MIVIASPDKYLCRYFGFENVSYLVKIFAVIFWTSMYCLVVLKKPNKTPEWSCRIIALIHGSTTSLIGLVQCLKETNSQESSKEAMNMVQYLLLSLSWGYFVFDLIWCLWDGTETKLMLFHHIYSTVALTRILSKQTAGSKICCGISGLEITNPLLQLRWFLRSEGYHNTYTFLFVEGSFIILFIFVRGVMGSILMYNTMKGSELDMEGRILFAIAYMISMVFIYNMYMHVKFKYVKPYYRAKRAYAHDMSFICFLNQVVRTNANTIQDNENTVLS